MTPAALLLVLASFVSAKPHTHWRPEHAPAQAQVIDQRGFNVLENIEPQDKFDGGSVSLRGPDPDY